MKSFYETRDNNLFVGSMTVYPFPLHVHEFVEVACVLTGSCTMQIDGHTYELQSGDVAIAFPLVPHSFDRLSQDVSGFAAFFPSDTFAELTGAFHTLLPDVPVIRARHVTDDARLAIARLRADAGEEKSPSRLPCLHLLTSNLLRALQFHPTGAYNEQGLADRVVRYIFDHACENITLRSASHGLGISESHLSHLFAQQFHINFRRFINAIRIDKAKMLMRDPNLTLTQIGYTCGYENMRTFRRAFTRETSALPAAYMRALRAEAGLPVNLSAEEEDDAN